MYSHLHALFLYGCLGIKYHTPFTKVNKVSIFQTKEAFTPDGVYSNMISKKVFYTSPIPSAHQVNA